MPYEKALQKENKTKEGGTKNEKQNTDYFRRDETMNLDSPESRLDYFFNEVNRCYQIAWQEVAERHSKKCGYSGQQHQQQLLGEQAKSFEEHHVLGQQWHV